MIAIVIAPTATDAAHAHQTHAATAKTHLVTAATDRATAGTMIGETGGMMVDVTVVMTDAMTDAIDLETVAAHNHPGKAGTGNTGIGGTMIATARATGP